MSFLRRLEAHFSRQNASRCSGVRKKCNYRWVSASRGVLLVEIKAPTYLIEDRVCDLTDFVTCSKYNFTYINLTIDYSIYTKYFEKITS